MFRGLLVSGVLAVVAAPAAAQPAAAPRLDLGSAARGCKAAEPGEVVVCGERGGDTYRIDPEVLAVERSREPPSRSRPPDYLSVNDQSCVPHGANGCPGRDVVPVLPMAVVAAKAAVLAIQGEDWRDPLRTRPDSYRLYREEKAKSEQARRPSASIGFGAGQAPDRPGH